MIFAIGIMLKCSRLTFRWLNEKVLIVVVSLLSNLHRNVYVFLFHYVRSRIKSILFLDLHINLLPTLIYILVVTKFYMHRVVCIPQNPILFQ